MASRSSLRYLFACPLAVLLLATIPIGVRRLYPGLLGTNSDGRDNLDEICFVAAYLRSLVIYFVIVLTPVSLVLAVLSGNSAKKQQLSRGWK
jgi:hypothetical protein